MRCMHPFITGWREAVVVCCCAQWHSAMASAVATAMEPLPAAMAVASAVARAVHSGAGLEAKACASAWLYAVAKPPPKDRAVATLLAIATPFPAATAVACGGWVGGVWGRVGWVRSGKLQWRKVHRRGLQRTNNVHPFPAHAAHAAQPSLSAPEPGQQRRCHRRRRKQLRRRERWPGHHRRRPERRTGQQRCRLHGQKWGEANSV